MIRTKLLRRLSARVRSGNNPSVMQLRNDPSPVHTGHRKNERSRDDATAQSAASGYRDRIHERHIPDQPVRCPSWIRAGLVDQNHTMHSADTGKYWKTPFVWEPGCPEPLSATLQFEAVQLEAIPSAMADVMAASVDESDRHVVDTLGPLGAAHKLLALAHEHFEFRHGWWRMAIDARGNAVGFVLPVLFQGKETWRQGKPEGTILYIGVQPSFRGRGFGAQLLAEATRILIDADCWRIFCDTGSGNVPMVRAFRSAGYKELPPWQRPLD